MPTVDWDERSESTVLSADSLIAFSSKARASVFRGPFCTFFLASLLLGVGGECPRGCWLIRLALREEWHTSCDEPFRGRVATEKEAATGRRGEVTDKKNLLENDKPRRSHEAMASEM